ncbi:hypothetical protein EJB05_42244 [Eragrostis curvula]|uniref:Cathepsin propeptide inhibitor domain-containing protein n=1 Tax=Eragrostis curvula TaxID=38414 RepID=A0A5J9TBZ3_9POAL|nr:hypothetical protein EJB05_42244 [Eragrostis curvula]
MRSSAAMAAAALLVLVLVPLTAADLSITYREKSEEEVRRVFLGWKAKHGKTYNSIDEEEFRYALFKEALRFIDKHNAAADAGASTYRLGLNPFTDLTDEEFRRGMLGYLPPDDLPNSVGLRKNAPVAEVNRFSR